MTNWGGLNNALYSWRVGLNTLFPDRSTRSDGGRADSNHASTSQHQPDSDGTVDAFDEDRNYLGSSDQTGNKDEDRIKAALDQDFMADPRAHLIITDRTIRNDEIGNWKVRPYGGDSPHTEHTHRQAHQALEDDGRPWKMTRTKALLRQMEDEKMPSVAEIAAATAAATAEAVWEYRVPAGYASAPTVQAQTAAKAATLTEVATRRLPEILGEIQTELARQAGVLDAIMARLDPPPPAE